MAVRKKRPPVASGGQGALHVVLIKRQNCPNTQTDQWAIPDSAVFRAQQHQSQAWNGPQKHIFFSEKVLKLLFHSVTRFIFFVQQVSQSQKYASDIVADSESGEGPLEKSFERVQGH